MRKPGKAGPDRREFGQIKEVSVVAVTHDRVDRKRSQRQKANHGQEPWPEVIFVTVGRFAHASISGGPAGGMRFELDPARWRKKTGHRIRSLVLGQREYPSGLCRTKALGSPSCDASTSTAMTLYITMTPSASRSGFQRNALPSLDRSPSS